MNIISKDIQLKGHRCLVISDVHAHVSLFQKALEKSKFQAGNDILILLGDFIEKGPSSLDMLHVMMDLSKYPNVYIVSGNCEQFRSLLIEIQAFTGYMII